MKISFCKIASVLLYAIALVGCSDAGFRDNPNDPGAVGFEDGEVTGDVGNRSVYDSRSKRSYKVVKIGNYYWLAENLNYSANNSFCYDGESENCKKRGRLYRWASKDLCPVGWKIPTAQDWVNLFDKDNGYVRRFLSDERVWEDSNLSYPNTYQFSIKPAGYRAADGTYRGFTSLAGFWTRTSDDEESAYSVWVDLDSPYPDIIPYNKNSALSVRCIKEI